MVDTLKRADDDARAAQTVPRAALWRALTPQMFRYGVLQRALTRRRRGQSPSPTRRRRSKRWGCSPRLVEGDPDNLKITVPGDLQRAERMLGDAARSDT